MNKTEFIAAMDNAWELFEKQNAAIEELDRLFGGSDGEIVSSIYDSQVLIVEILARVVDDEDDWLSWFFFEKGIKATSSGIQYSIHSPEDLVNFCGWFGSEWPEERADIIGQNGNDGEHYDSLA